MRQTTKNSKDKVKLVKAINLLTDVQDTLVKKLGSGATNAQAHVGLLTKAHGDLKILRELLKDADTTSVPTGAPTSHTEQTNSKGGRPKGSANKTKA